MKRFSLFSIFPVALAVVCAAMSFSANAQHSHKGGKAHSHGAAELEVSVSSAGVLSVYLEGAMDNFLGFEHRPKTEAQRAAVEALRLRMQKADALLQLPAAAGCQLTSSAPKSLLFSPAPTAVSKNGERHADIEVRQSFQCSNPAALSSAEGISLSLFNVYPRLQRVTVSFAAQLPGESQSRVGSQRLSPKKAERIFITAQ